MPLSHRRIVVAVIAALFFGKASAEENPKPECWPEAQDGIAVQLRLKNIEMREDAQPNTDVKARLDCELFLKNVSDKPRRLTLPAHRPQAYEVKWVIKDSAGVAWTPAFLPPPLKPMPAGKSAYQIDLKPGEELGYAQLHGITGFHSTTDNQNVWYQVLPAGEYAIAVKLQIPFSDAEFTTHAAKLRVGAANDAVKGLKLTLELAAETTGEVEKAKPVKLCLTFCNVGDKPLKLDTYDLVWSNLNFQISGGEVSRSELKVRREMRAPEAADFKTLEINQKHVLEFAFPGEVGRYVYTLKPAAGPYRIRASYVVPEKEDPNQPLQAGRWSGKVTSNEIRLLIKP